MNVPRPLRAAGFDLVTAFTFLTRLPMPRVPYDDGSLARAAKFFPIVGLVLGAGAALLYNMLAPHLPPTLAALGVVLALVLATGAFHEDGLADATDAFGGALRDRSRILLILRDSRIGAYGAVAVTLSLVARIALLASLPPARAAAYLLAAHTLCRWSSLPLGAWLPSAHPAGDGLGFHLAGRTSAASVASGTAITLAIVVPALRLHALVPFGVTLAVVYGSGLFYRSRLGGITGDCFGATNQLTEIAVLCCGVWR